MEMWLKSANVVLLIVAGATFVLPTEHRLNLEKTNDTEKRERTVFPGSSLKLHCCLTGNISERCYVSWHFRPSGKNQTELHTEENLCNWTKITVCNLGDICDNMPCNLSNITEANIGWYYCKVRIEIPRLHDIESTKTKIILENFMEKTTVQSQTTKIQVTSKEEPDQNENLWMWIFVGVSSFILIVIALLVICAVQKRPCNRSIGEEPIYVNTRMGNPSPQLMPAENPKTVFSSKNLQTPNSARRYEGRNQRYK